nr:DapH/DapD/GlmU-related protein [Rhizobium sp. L1K21]
MLQGDVRKGISIGSNVWVGGNVTILDGVNIGSNCVIGAGTLVAKSVPENTVVFNAIEPITRKVYDD